MQRLQSFLHWNLQKARPYPDGGYRYCWRFHQAFDGSAHFLDSEWYILQIKYDLFLTCRMKNLCCCSTLFCYFKSNVFVRTSIFFTELLLELFCVSFYLSNGIRKKFCGALSCNGIVFLPACKRNKAYSAFFLSP